MNNDWNSLNTLSCDAATVGNYDLGLVNKKKMSNGKKYLSDKPLSQEGAVKQMRAVVLEEKKAKSDKPQAASNA